MDNSSCIAVQCVASALRVRCERVVSSRKGCSNEWIAGTFDLFLEGNKIVLTKYLDASTFSQYCPPATKVDTISASHDAHDQSQMPAGRSDDQDVYMVMVNDSSLESDFTLFEGLA